MKDNKTHETINSIPIPILLIGRDCTIQYINRAFYSLMNYSKSEIMNTKIWFKQLFGNEVRAKESYKEWRKNLIRVSERKESKSVLWTADTELGKRILQVKISYFDENTNIITFNDITDTIELSDTYIENNEKFRILSNSSTVGIMMYQKDKWIYANRAAEQICGYKEYELKHQNFWDLVHTDMRDKVMNRGKKRLLGNEVVNSYEIKIITKDGKRKWVDFWADTTMYNKQKAVIAAVVDITERKHLRQELIQSQKMESLGQLVGGIAHDFNNFLTPIVINAESMMYNADKDGILYKQTREIMQAANMAKDLISKLLIFGRKQEVQMLKTDIDNLISDLFPILRSTVPKGIELEYINGCTDIIIHADKTQVKQVIMNLIMNSVDAIDCKRGNINIESACIMADRDYSAVYPELQPGRYYMLAVSDDGCGIDDSIAKEVFNPFFTTKPQGKGTGLGLSTVYGIMREHNGAVRFYSERNRGTTFKLYFPIENESPQKPFNIQKHINPSEYNIFVVDDNKDILNITAKILLKAGFNVSKFTAPEKAIEGSIRFNGKIDLLLTDVVMPKINGKQLYEEMSTYISDLRCIYMSGYTKSIMSKQGVLDSDVALIRKPFSSKQLLEVIVKSLSL